MLIETSGVSGDVRGIVVAPEDSLRANTYMLLASLLRAPLDSDSLADLAILKGGDGPMGVAISALASAALRTQTEVADQEFQDIFIGIGAAELKPYASYYLTGFLYEKPLAKLRQEMERIGIARADGVAEPEDHIAALCEMMCGLITGAFGEAADLATQRAFFDTHIGSWAGRFFENLETSPTAKFYRPVGTIGKLFMEIESRSFEMAA